MRPALRVLAWAALLLLPTAAASDDDPPGAVPFAALADARVHGLFGGFARNGTLLDGAFVAVRLEPGRIAGLSVGGAPFLDAIEASPPLPAEPDLGAVSASFDSPAYHLELHDTPLANLKVVARGPASLVLRFASAPGPDALGGAVGAPRDYVLQVDGPGSLTWDAAGRNATATLGGGAVLFAARLARAALPEGAPLAFVASLLAGEEAPRALELMRARNVSLAGARPNGTLERLGQPGAGWVLGLVRVAGLREPLARGEQVVVRVDGREAFPVARGELAGHVARGLAAYAVELVPAGASAWVVANLSLVPGLEIATDLEPPRMLGYEVTNVTDSSLLLTTRTSEHALAVLRHWHEGREPVVSETPNPSLLQHFPLLALRANTTYSFDVAFRDFSGNERREGPFTFRTAPPAQAPAPRLLSREPEPGAHEGSVRRVAATFEAAAGRIEPWGVRLLVDKRDVTSDALVTGGAVAYEPPQPLGPGLHTVLLDLRNTEGGRERFGWEFTVEPARPIPGAGLAILFLALLAAATARPPRRPSPRPARPMA